jgi:hypothetical protein
MIPVNQAVMGVYNDNVIVTQAISVLHERFSNSHKKEVLPVNRKDSYIIQEPLSANTALCVMRSA